jgi:hypothetical protein
MTAPDHNDHDRVSSDLVEYLVIQVPDQTSLSSVGPAIAAVTANSSIRILDLVAVTTDEFGGVHQAELDSMNDLRNLASIAHRHGSLLSAQDVRLAALALAPGSAGLVIVVEDTWAAPLAAAARDVGGRIVAGERIPAHRVEVAIAHAMEPAPVPASSVTGRG